MVDIANQGTTGVDVQSGVPTQSGQNVQASQNVQTDAGVLGSIETGVDTALSTVNKVVDTAATASNIAAAVLDANSAPAPADPVQAQLQSLHTRVTAIEQVVNPVVAIGAEVAGAPGIVERVTAVETVVERLASFFASAEPTLAKMLADLGVSL